MPWAMTTQMDEALRSKIVRPAILFALDHPAGWLRLWSGVGTIYWNGDAYRGAGTLLTCDAAEETTEIQVARLTVNLTAPDFDDDTMAIITTPMRRRSLYSWKGLLDDFANIIPEPRMRFSGFADAPGISEDERHKRTISLTAVGALHNLISPVHAQVSNEEQIKRHPGDSGLALMSSIPNQQLVWDVGAYNSFTPP